MSRTRDGNRNTFVRRLSWVVLGMALLLGAAASPVEASCVDNRFFVSSYIYTPGAEPVFYGTFPVYRSYYTSVTPDVRGSFWSLGNGDPADSQGNDEGTMSQRAWLYGGYGYQLFSLVFQYPALISGTWAAPGVDGCIDIDGSDPTNPDPDQCMVALVEDQIAGRGYFAMFSESPGDFGRYDLFDVGSVTLAPIPGVRILGSTVTGATTLDVDVTADAFVLDGAAFLQCAPAQNDTVIQGYRLFTRSVPAGQNIDASRDTADWTDTGLEAALGATTTIPVDCASGEDLYACAQLRLDSGFATEYCSRELLLISGACEVCQPVSALDATCDGIDDDCDADVDEDTDADGDGFSFCAGEDCDDTDPEISPAALEIVCDGVNNDCSSITQDDPNQDGDALSFCLGDCDDVDPNNWVSCASCVDGDGDGFFVDCDAYVTIDGPDCDDADPARNANCGCPATTLLRKSAQPEPAMRALYDFRDGVLGSDPQRARFVDLYYEHAAEASWIVLRDPLLASDATALIERWLPRLRELSAGGRVVLRESELREIGQLLQRFSARSGPDLRSAADLVQQALGDRGLLLQMGIEVLPEAQPVPRPAAERLAPRRRP